MSTSLPSAIRALAVVTPLSTESSFQVMSTAVKPPKQEYRYYQCNLHSSNTYECKKSETPYSGVEKGPVGVSQMIAVPSYFPKTFDKHYIKSKLAPAVKIVSDK